MISNPEFKKNIDKIAMFCIHNDIPFSYKTLFDGYQLTFPWCEGDVICHFGSYGCFEGFVESYMFPWDKGDVSMLTPEEFCKKLARYHHLITKVVNTN